MLRKADKETVDNVGRASFRQKFAAPPGVGLGRRNHPHTAENASEHDLRPRAAPYLGDDRGHGDDIEISAVCLGEHLYSTSVVTLQGNERPSVENEPSHATRPPSPVFADVRDRC